MPPASPASKQALSKSSRRRVCLLTGSAELDADDNAALLAPAFAARDCDVELACIDSLHLAAGRVLTRSSGSQQILDLGDCALIWVLGFGQRTSFLDKMQLLSLVPPEVRWVNSIAALLTLHGKYALAAAGCEVPHPATWAFNAVAPLIATARRKGGRFVLKPPGGSFGEGIVIADAESTVFADAATALTRGGAFCLLQRWVPEVTAGEFRVLVARGEVIGEYRRIGSGVAAANLARGGRAELAPPDGKRHALALTVAGWLEARGVGYAGIDLAGGMVLEVNIINPGGLATLAALGAGQRALAVVDALLADSR